MNYPKTHQFGLQEAVTISDLKEPSSATSLRHEMYLENSSTPRKCKPQADFREGRISSYGGVMPWRTKDGEQN